MPSLFHITSAILKIGVALAICGGLARAAVYFRDEAFKSTQTGLVSLSKLNKQLLTGHSLPRKRNNSRENILERTDQQ